MDRPPPYTKLQEEVQSQQGYNPQPQGYAQTSQQQYPSPQQGSIPPQQGSIPPQQGSIPPQQGFVPAVQGYPQMAQGYPQATPQQTVVVTPATVGTTVVGLGNCPNCRVGTLREEISVIGIVLAVIFFPLGLLFLLCMKDRKCNVCNSTF